MTCTAAYDDDVEALDLEHGREGVAPIGVGLVLVVGGEAGAHGLLMELEMPEMRLVGCRRLLLRAFASAALVLALEDAKSQSFLKRVPAF